MAATRSFSSVALLTFYAFTFLFLTRGPIQNGSKCLLRRPLGLFSTGTVFSGEAGLIFVVKLGGKFRLDLRSESYFKSSLPVTKWTKHGSTSLHIPGHDPPLDITVFSDVSRNPGPQVLHWPFLYSGCIIRLDELGQTFCSSSGLCVSSIKTGTRRIMRPDELPFVVRRSRRISKESSSRSIMRLVPVFILETHNQTNYKCLPKFVRSDNASLV